MKDIEIACNIIRAASRSAPSQTPAKFCRFSSHEVNIQNSTATALGKAFRFTFNKSGKT